MTMAAVGIAPVRHPLPRSLPGAAELADLGRVLCVWRSDLGGELDGWACARSAHAGALIHADGVLEWIVFRDPLMRACWRLYRMPDTDADAWQRVSRRLACDGDGLSAASQRCPLWRKLCRHVAGERWCSSVLDFHAAWIDGQRTLGATLRIASAHALPSVAQALRHAGSRSTLTDVAHPAPG